MRIPVERPARALPDRGGVNVSFQESIVGGLDTMRDYMARYPYPCLEQQVSAAIALGEPSRWTALMGAVGNHMDRDGLLRFFPIRWLRGSPILTAYVLTIADAAGNALPDRHRERMLKGLADYLADEIKREADSPHASESLARLIVLAALARYGVADRTMLDHFDLHLELLPTSALLDWIDILDRVAPDRADLVTAKDILRSRMHLQGTTFGFSTEHVDRLWWFMVATDGNAARSIVSLLDDPQWRGDMPRMVRGLFGRQRAGRWQTTVANAWGAVAVTRFAGAFEAEAVGGTSLVRSGDAVYRRRWADEAAPEPTPVEIPWAAAKTVSLDHEGTGAPWALVQMHAAIPLRRPVQRGYRITRTLEPVARRGGQTWRRGDVARVALAVDADADMTWVVVEDPLPPGAVVLGSGLGGDSAMLAGTHDSGDRWPVFTERRFESYRAYYRYVPKGRTTLRYNVRYNSAGTFRLPPTRVEAMYAPEMHAEWPVKAITVR